MEKHTISERTKWGDDVLVLARNSKTGNVRYCLGNQKVDGSFVLPLVGFEALHWYSLPSVEC